MSNSLNMNKILNNPIEQESWGQLQNIIKMLHEYMAKCAKNREYTQAQKAKQKIDEANIAIKNRNVYGIKKRMSDNIRKLQIRQAEQKHQFLREWELKSQEADKMLSEGIARRNHMNQEQLKRLKQQVELALPIHHSPDDKLKSFRHEEKKLAAEGKFKEAQKVKEQIQRRQSFLEEKHRQLRQANIKQMMKQLEDKQDRDMKERQKHKRSVLEEILKDRNKKLRELQEKHNKEIKEMKWMHQEEIRMLGL